jgi:hypothetical protein
MVLERAITSLLVIFGFIGSLIILYAVVKTTTVAILDAVNLSKKKDKDNGKT